MRTPISSLALFEPRSLKDALRLMRHEERVIPLAGATDVYVSLNFGGLAGARLLNLWSLDELRGIVRRRACISIGALTTYTELQASPVVRHALPMLVAAASQVGGRQVQNRGTVGGNIGNASPAGDILPVLAATEAVVVLRRADGERRVPLGSYFTGYRQSVRQPDELIVAVEIPPVHGRQWFRKVGTRAAQAISKVVMAGVRADRPRLAVGSVGPTVLRLPNTEEVLARNGSLDDAQETLVSEIVPINDARSTAAYRRRVAMNLLANFWDETA
jgi:xanthine dehydrogenase small subunit